MSKIISIATAVPTFKHEQSDLYAFADKVYSRDETESRKLKFLYRQSNISSRYSVIPDYSLTEDEWQFFPGEASKQCYPGLEKRMEWFNRHAAPLSVEAIEKCIAGKIDKSDITHLITVTCTGLSAPGLDLQVMDLMQLPTNIFRSSVNFMGCYAAVHALKLADALCKNDKKANVIIVCTELCTLHFQKEISPDNITSSLLFADGSAAALIQHNDAEAKGIVIDNYYAEVSFNGKKDMAWELSSTGFLMTLTGYVPALIKEDFKILLRKALDAAGLQQEEISHWCIHPGGSKILDAIAVSAGLEKNDLHFAYDVLWEYGNMSSPTILFVLKKILDELEQNQSSTAKIFGAAFGPGLTMETFTASYA
ncbi:MAG: type III polyketide synthase [Ferruginibacter sp.]